ncbi:unnamed protein product, partial [marine sediment metagenome]
ILSGEISVLTEKILKRVEGLADITRLHSYDEYTVGWALFKGAAFTDILDLVEDVAEDFTKNGEKVRCNVSNGKVYDMGSLSLEVEHGVVMELYDYGGMCTAFIRLYRIQSEGKSWLSLYIDENPKTPWWNKAERQKVNGPLTFHNLTH